MKLDEFNYDEALENLKQNDAILDSKVSLQNQEIQVKKQLKNYAVNFTVLNDDTVEAIIQNNPKRAKQYNEQSLRYRKNNITESIVKTKTKVDPNYSNEIYNFVYTMLKEFFYKNAVEIVQSPYNGYGDDPDENFTIEIDHKYNTNTLNYDHLGLLKLQKNKNQVIHEGSTQYTFATKPAKYSKHGMQFKTKMGIGCSNYVDAYMYQFDNLQGLSYFGFILKDSFTNEVLDTRYFEVNSDRSYIVKGKGFWHYPNSKEFKDKPYYKKFNKRSFTPVSYDKFISELKLANKNLKKVYKDQLKEDNLKTA